MLSGGQWQLVAFARALLADPRILIQDVAMANVDAYTEAQIQQAMDEIRRGRTTLIIARRFSTVGKADRVVVVDAGRIMGKGSHQELLRSNATYQRFYRRQWADARADATACDAQDANAAKLEVIAQCRARRAKCVTLYTSGDRICLPIARLANCHWAACCRRCDLFGGPYRPRS